MYHLRKLRISQQLLNIFYKNQNSKRNTQKYLCTFDRPAIILGIETSFDDTGIAIVDSTGKILGEAHNSQLTQHIQLGGVNPPLAKDLHRENIHKVYEECLKSANMELNDVDAIAVTVEPGLVMTLMVGRDLALNLSRTANKPVIPIHHMEAHALMARMTEKIDFPFLVLLISGGHCLLLLAENFDQYKILGEAIDRPPGETFDKIARELKLQTIPEYSKISGGQAIELAAKKADDPYKFFWHSPMSHYRDCDFSFSGSKSRAHYYIRQQEDQYDLVGTEIIPDVNNISAGLLFHVTKHLCQKTERAMVFIERNELIPDGRRTLVVSGGVASNNFIYNGLNKLCTYTGYKLVRPPPKLCTDNGIMIAWNGVEKYINNKGILRDRNEIEKIEVSHRSPIGENWRNRIEKANIKRKWLKLKFEELLDP